MTKSVISSWISRLGVQERNLPLIIYQGGVYSPQAVYDEVMRGSPLGDALQKLVEARSFGTTYADEQAVAKLRLTEIMRAKPERPLFATLSGKTFTPSELLAEIQNETEIGRQWISNEKSHMEKIVSVR